MLCFVGCLLPSMQGNAQNEVLLRKEIDKIIHYETRLDYEKTPGFLIGVIVRDSSHVLSYGSKYKVGSTLLSKHDVFELGEASHIFLAQICAILVEQDQLDYADVLSKYLPELKGNESSKQISIEDLLSHQSGLPIKPHDFGLSEVNAKDPYANYQEKDLLSFLAHYNFPEDRNYLFSNVNFAVLEVVLKRIIKGSLKDYLQQNTFDPLNIKAIGFNSDSLATAYNAVGKEATPLTFGSFQGALGWRSNMEDLLKFVRFQMEDNLSSELHIPSVSTHKKSYSKIAKAWHVFKYRKYHDILVSGGVTEGHTCFIGFVKETKTAVIILGNSKYGLDSLGFLVLRMLNNNWKKKRKR